MQARAQQHFVSRQTQEQTRQLHLSAVHMPEMQANVRIEGSLVFGKPNVPVQTSHRPTRLGIATDEVGKLAWHRNREMPDEGPNWLLDIGRVPFAVLVKPRLRVVRLQVA